MRIIKNSWADFLSDIFVHHARTTSNYHHQLWYYAFPFIRYFLSFQFLYYDDKPNVSISLHSRVVGERSGKSTKIIIKKTVYRKKQKKHEKIKRSERKKR